MGRLFSLILLCTLVFSCKEKTKQDTATVLYQCPMDCENDKTYTEKGSCPVCKMDLKTLGHSESCTCASHEEKCKCEKGKCTCDKCPEHS
ncbi:heavy metal-binding domain-containing protein [uncultured Maribacter sp.]|uniref:heavy metal-binding domain-containing protein n=1 Tax=uncultured Maribacter sp. TaxID=431308 RepID=UPI002626D8A2|nr:heavy metal-binding domain-containing protein [uncultured Maribacter sp.]